MARDAGGGSIPTSLYSTLIDRALQKAATAHRQQLRKGTEQPYISHPVMVALLVQRAGFDEETVAAAVLHDVVEDTGVPLEELAREFGPRVAELVGWLSERKLDERAQKRSWEDRKQEHCLELMKAPGEAKAIALADKLHNLHSVLQDLSAGRPPWSRFNAPPDRWLWNVARMVEVCDGEDPRLQQLAQSCREVLAAIHNHFINEE